MHFSASSLILIFVFFQGVVVTSTGFSSPMTTSSLSKHFRKELKKETNELSPPFQVMSSNGHKVLMQASIPTEKDKSKSSSPNEFVHSMFQVKWPEIKKFFSLSFMMFFIVYVFTMTRDTKDALIVTNCGAESIAFLKVYGVIPAAAAFMFGYSYLSNYFSPNQLFYITLVTFLLFYLLFAFVMYPLRNYLHPLTLQAPTTGLSYVFNIMKYWTFSLYYIVSELWGSAGIPLLFWSCANDVVSIEQAKRLYPLISLIGNTGPIFSGLTMSFVSKQVSKVITNDELAFETSLKVLTGIMMFSGAIISFLHYTVRKLEKTAVDSSLSGNKINKTSDTGATSHSKAKLSLMDSIKVLTSSKYLLNIATMVLSYGLSIEFTEIIWKATVKAAFPVKTDYLNFMGRYSTLVGMAAFVMMFVGTNVVKFMGWKAGALLTPLLMGTLAAPFFLCLITKGSSSQTALLAAVYIGLVTNVFSKATKYAVFDPTKEMAYIPLDSNSKTKGKAAIDVLGARLGKSGGALAQQFLVLLWGNIFNGAGIIAGLFYLVIAAWIKSVWELSHQFEKTSNISETEVSPKEKAN